MRDEWGLPQLLEPPTALRQPQTLSIKQVTVLRIIHSLLCWSGQGNGVLQLILACNYLLLKTVGLDLFASMCTPEKTREVCHS